MTAEKVVLFVLVGCSHCAWLEAQLDSKKIPYTTTSSVPAGSGFSAAPGTVLRSGTFAGYPACDDACQLAKIVAEHDALGNVPTPAPGPIPTPGGTPTVWSNVVKVTYVEHTTDDSVAPGTTPLDWQPSDITLDPVSPAPPAAVLGLTIALRDHKKAKTSRKVM